MIRVQVQVSINQGNKQKYSNGTYPEVTNIIWLIGELDGNILKNFPNLTKLVCEYNQIKDLNSLQYCKVLTNLYCANNLITDLSPLQHFCKGLMVLNCSHNVITDLSPLQYCKALTKLQIQYNQITNLSPLKYCIGLTKLYCGNNQIKDLNPLQYCTELTTLYCNNNIIININSLKKCTKLEELDCSHNKIKDLNGLRYCLRLNDLYCDSNDIININSLQYCIKLILLSCNHNKIIDLNPLRNCTELIELHCSYNQITDLSPSQYCRELHTLYCVDNQITSLEPLIYLRRLRYLSNHNNPLNPPSIQVTRFLERIRRNRTNNNSIYNDTQNVHDVKVQQSVMDSVRNLMKDGLPNNEEIILDIDSVLTSELKATTKSRLLEYFEETDYHVVLLITYKELFTYVWNRIINNPNKLELLKILDDNIQDSECKCFTGRFNRTLSTLVGFYDDIQINISDNSRIGAIILQVKDTIIPYDVTKHRELAQIALRDAGYDSETVELWTTAIEE